MAGIHSRRQNLGQGMAQWQVQVTHLPDVSNCQPNADDAGSAAWPARRRPAEHLGTVRAEASERLARRGKDGHGHATLGLPNGGSRMAFGSRSVTTARPGHGRLSGRSAARRMQAAVRVSGGPGDGAPGLAIGPCLTPGCAQPGTPARAAAIARSSKPRMSVMRSPLTVSTCQRLAVPPPSRAAGVPVTSSPTRSVPGPAVTSVTTARAPVARAPAH